MTYGYTGGNHGVTRIREGHGWLTSTPTPARREHRHEQIKLPEPARCTAWGGVWWLGSGPDAVNRFREKVDSAQVRPPAAGQLGSPRS